MNNQYKKRRSWVRRAFFNYKNNKVRLVKLKRDYDSCEIPSVGGGNGCGTSGSHENGAEKSVIHYLAERERLERAVKSCEWQIALVDKTLEHFAVEELLKGMPHKRYIECRFLRGMSYRRAAVEFEVAESTAGYWMEEIYNTAEMIAEIEGYLKRA